MTLTEANDQLGHPSPLRRRAAARWLRRRHFLPECQQAIPGLTAALGDPDPLVAADACDALALIATPDESLVNRTTRFATLGLIGPAARSAVPRLVAALPDEGAIGALRLMGVSVDAVPALLDACRSVGIAATRHAVAAAADVGRPAVGAALSRLADPDRAVRGAARDVVERIGWVPDEGARLLIESFLDDALWGHRMWRFDRSVQRAIGWIEAKEIVREEARRHPNPEVRRILMKALSSADVNQHASPGEAHAVSEPGGMAEQPVMLAVLEGTQSPASLYEERSHEIDGAAWASDFDWLRGRWPWFVGGLIARGATCPDEWLEHRSAVVRLNACRIRGHEDRAIRIAASFLEEYDWFGESFWTFIAAAELLAHAGTRAHVAMPQLMAILERAPAGSLPRQLAVQLIARIGPDAAHAAPVLIVSGEAGAAEALVRVLPEYAGLYSALDVIVNDQDCRSDLGGLTLDEMQMYLRALSARRACA